VELIVIYMAGMILLMGAWVYRIPNEDGRMIFVLGLIWPITIVLVLFQIFMMYTGWDWNVAQGIKTFGYRKPTNPQVKGFAVTIFGTEFQFSKAK
jgi:membrane associated rhomboid family serine protease